MANRRRPALRRGLTLIELLVVILIITLVSVVALPAVLPALNHREVSEAGRILQGALVGARDQAIHDGQPSGIRLLPDPGFGPGLDATAAGQINPFSILAYNRVIPIGPAPEYSEGYCMPTTLLAGAYSPAYSAAALSNTTVPAANYPFALMLVESPVDPGDGTITPTPNSPTSWFWNVRVGDKIQLNNAGPWYTIVGPMVVQPNGTNVATGKASGLANPELFVNAGPPGAPTDLAGVLPTLTYTINTTDDMGNPTQVQASFPAEYLILVNGQDDNKNGWIDEGFDGVDNDGDNLFDELTCNVSTLAGEWEQETWLGAALTNDQAKVPYTIRRRPAPLPGAREIALPTSMVIDATTLFLTRERSRLPINPQTQYTGYVDIVLNPDGTVLPTVDYSSPAAFGMDQAFYHFWLAERQDLAAVPLSPTATPVPIYAGAKGPPVQPHYFLPVAQPGGSNPGNYPGPYLKGRYSVLSLSARTGHISVAEEPPFFFDATLGYTNSPTSGGIYNPVYPFIQAEQGAAQGP